MLKCTIYILYRHAYCMVLKSSNCIIFIEKNAGLRPASDFQSNKQQL